MDLSIDPEEKSQAQFIRSGSILCIMELVSRIFQRVIMSWSTWDTFLRVFGKALGSAASQMGQSTLALGFADSSMVWEGWYSVVPLLCLA